MSTVHLFSVKTRHKIIWIYSSFFLTAVIFASSYLFTCTLRPPGGDCRRVLYMRNKIQTNMCHQVLTDSSHKSTAQAEKCERFPYLYEGSVGKQCCEEEWWRHMAPGFILSENFLCFLDNYYRALMNLSFPAPPEYMLTGMSPEEIVTCSLFSIYFFLLFWAILEMLNSN